MARQFIYYMAGLSKTYGTKKVLEDIHLQFYPDAKIGILGPNGADLERSASVDIFAVFNVSNAKTLGAPVG